MMADTLKPKLLPFTLNKQFREYVWGGNKLRPGPAPTAEVWAVYETNTIASGIHVGRKLAELVDEFSSDLLGSKVSNRIGKRFPILIKLLDCNQWLSLQVHPNDEQAEQLVGKGQFGKTEAWYFLDADEKAEILCGTHPGVTRADVEKAVREGTILEQTNRVPVSTGDFVLIPAGTIHALGPGLLVYEVQESSDTTYRVFDWNRPASQGRTLHIEQSIAVIDPDKQPLVRSADRTAMEEDLLSCDYFHLDKLVPESEAIPTTLNGESFHALTVIAGTARLSGDGWAFFLAQYDSLIIPACCREYDIQKQTGCELLRATA